MTIITIKNIKDEQVNVNNVFIKSKLYKIIYIKSSLNIKIRLSFILRLI